jgi:phosphorylcholine metabolism protein LicD
MVNTLIRNEGIMTEYNRALSMNVDLKKNNHLFIVNFSRHYMLFEMIKKVHKLLIQNGIKYFMIGGILIGLERHNSSFIPWDDDLDIGIMKEDKEKLRIIINNTDDLYVDQTSKTLDKICYKYDKNIGKYDENIFIDVFTFENVNDTYRYSQFKHRELWPNQSIHNIDLFPLQRRKLNLYLPDGKLFETTEIITPNNIKDYLEKLYPNYMNKMVCNNNHIPLYRDIISKQLERNIMLIIIFIFLIILYLIRK